MPDTKALRNRIKSVDSTLHLTKAMGLVAASKLRRAGEAMQAARQYADAVRELVARLATSKECERSAYMRQTPEESVRTRIIVIAGDRGMAGGYNANIFRTSATLPKAEYITIGKRACDRFGNETVSSEHFGTGEASALAKRLTADFAAGEYDRLGILSTHYVSMMTQEPVIEWVLPLTVMKPDTSVSGNAGMIFEPDEATILNEVVPEYVTGILMAAVRESFASEVAARRNAMDSAGKNATEMINTLQLAYNRARQGAITQEITEIVAGANA